MSISACNLIDTSRFVEAEEAYRIDLLDRLVPADTLLEELCAGPVHCLLASCRHAGARAPYNRAWNRPSKNNYAMNHSAFSSRGERHTTSRKPVTPSSNAAPPLYGSIAWYSG